MSLYKSWKNIVMSPYKFSPIILGISLTYSSLLYPISNNSIGNASWNGFKEVKDLKSFNLAYKV